MARKRKFGDSIRIAIAAPFNILALGQTMSPPHPTQTRTERLANWVNARVLPKDVD